MISKIRPSEEERSIGAFSSGTMARVAQRFRADGVLVLENVVDAALIARARRAFGEAYGRYLDGKKHRDAPMVGDRRLMITVDLEPPFDAPQLFANPWILSVMEVFLHEGFVLGAFGVVCSLPSAPAQHLHSDGPPLFPDLVGRLVPASAITVAVPLLEMNEVHGTTALYPGSHRDASCATTGKGIEPIVREGSCLLWDYRLVHGGTPNRSTLPRPLLYLVYCRPWFVDEYNFPTQPPLRASKRSLSRLPEQHRRLLARARLRRR
jgi:ectoine hydroxylase-related dioxygenase (phytanoyl-CoA dioxygenase family)